MATGPAAACYSSETCAAFQPEHIMPLLVLYKYHAVLNVHNAQQGYRIDAVDHDDHTICKAPIRTQALAAYATT